MSNDGIINAAQKMLLAQSKHKIGGWQLTPLAKERVFLLLFPLTPPLLQFLHVGKCHWVTTSNVKRPRWWLP